jgi:ABC-type Fe3+ transport system permease subunit
MRWITAIKCFLLVALVVGLLGMPVGVFISFEPDGGTPADELHQKKRLAQTVLVASGATAITAVCGLYLAGLAQRRRP